MVVQIKLEVQFQPNVVYSTEALDNLDAFVSEFERLTKGDYSKFGEMQKTTVNGIAMSIKRVDV